MGLDFHPPQIPGPAGSPGPTGPAGPVGPDGTGFQWKGNYDAAVTYNKGDVVFKTPADVDGFTSFIATQDGVLGITPVNSSVEWDGIVIAGPAGPAGPTGPAGPAGPPGTGGTGSTTLSALTDVSAAVSAPVDGEDIYWNAAQAKWDGRPRSVFYISDYGGKGDGVTDCGPAFRAALLAAAASGVRGIVFFGPGTWLLNSAASGTTNFGSDWNAFGRASNVTIAGSGKLATTLKYGNGNVRCLTGVTSVGLARVYDGLTIRDFTIDNNNFTSPSSGCFGVIFNGGGRYTLKHVTIQRVDTINVPRATSGSERRCINMSVNSNQYTDATLPGPIEDILITDCYFGRSGGGGNYGVLIQGITSSGYSTRGIAANGGRTCQIDLDRITIERCNYDSGLVGAPAGVFSSTGYMVGGQGLGKKLRITDCRARGSFDDGFEIGSWYDVVVSNCVSENCPNEGFYLAPLGGMPEPDRSRITFINCTTIRDDAVGSNVGNWGFRAAAKSGVEYGDLSFINCRSVGNIALGFNGQAFIMEAQARRVYIENFTYTGVINRVASANSQSGSTSPIWFANPGGKQHVTINGLHLDGLHTYDIGAFSGYSFGAEGIDIDVAADTTFDVRDVTFGMETQFATGTSTANFTSLNYRGFQFAKQGRGSESGDNQNIFNDPLDNLDVYIWDTSAAAGGAPGTDVVATATGLQAATTPTAEKRLRGHAGGVSGAYGTLGPNTDNCSFVGALTGSSVTDFKVGTSPKALEDTAPGRTVVDPSVNYLEIYLTDDGTNSFLCLDKVTGGGGTRVSLLGAIVGGAGNVTAITTPQSYQSDRGIQIAARISPATTYYVRGKIQDNVVTADYWGTTAPSINNVTGSPTLTTSVTLSTSDNLIFGDSVQGRPMWSFVGMDTNARLQNITQVRMHVIGGMIMNFRHPVRNNLAKKLYLFTANLDSTRLRFRNLQLGFDAGLANPAVTTEFETFDATQRRQIRVMPGSTYATTPTVAVITPGASPYTYANADGFDEQIYLFGGTVSNVEVSVDDGTTFTQVATASPTSVFLRPNDLIRITYSVVPTVRRQPIL